MSVNKNSKSEQGVVFRLDFPTYQIRAINDDILLVSGGGGSAKTGVLNSIQLLRLPISNATGTKESKQQQQPLLAESLGCIDTDVNAVMSLDVVSMDKAALLCTAEGDKCVEYLIDCNNSACTGQSLHEPSTPTIRDNDSSELRKRSKQLPTESTSTTTTNKDRRRRRSESFTCFVEPGLFSFTTLAVVRSQPIGRPPSLGSKNKTLAASAQAGLTCVRYAKAASYLILTGSMRQSAEETTIGRVRVMVRSGCECNTDDCSEYKGFIPYLDIDASIPSRGSPTEVDRLCISPDSQFLCTICDSPDNRTARVWHLKRMEEGEQLYASLTLPGQHSVEYRIRHCLFGRTPGRSLSTGGCILYLTHMPVSVRAKVANFITVWLFPGNANCQPDISNKSLSPSASQSAPANLAQPIFCVKHALPPQCKPACVTVSEDGRHFALGSLEGQIMVYESRQDGLFCVYNGGNAHSTFVTDMTFLPITRSRKSNLDWELVSISTDTRLRYFSQPLKPNRKIKWSAVLFRLFVILAIVYFVSLTNSMKFL